MKSFDTEKRGSSKVKAQEINLKHPAQVTAFLLCDMLEVKKEVVRNKYRYTSCIVTHSQESIQ